MRDPLLHGERRVLITRLRGGFLCPSRDINGKAHEQDPGCKLDWLEHLEDFPHNVSLFYLSNLLQLHIIPGTLQSLVDAAGQHTAIHRDDLTGSEAGFRTCKVDQGG